MSEQRSSGARRSYAERVRSISVNMRRQLQVVIGLSVVVGVLTGFTVAGLHAVIVEGLWARFDRDIWWVALLPLAGLLGSTLILRFTRERSTETTEDYVRVFHDPSGRISMRSVPLRLLASVMTIGFGGSMGLEGPSIYVGSAIGDAVERRMRRLITDEDRKVLLVAGAAAGIAAIFKAPVTGVIFALEVPYRDDLARHALIPAIFAAASAYVAFVTVAGTTALFPITTTHLGLRDLAGSIVVGLGCGVGARAFVWLYSRIVELNRRLSFAWRGVTGGAALAGLGVLSLVIFHRPLVLGPGYDAISLAARGKLDVTLLAALFVMKLVATTSTGAGNGVGGLFFPCVLMGAALGGVLGHVVPGPPSLFAIVGIAAFLSGSYSVPLAAVAFVAEATGAPGYIVPGLIAAALAYIVSGERSLSHRQRSRRLFDLDTRLSVEVAEVMSLDFIEVPPTCSLREFATSHVVRARARTVPVSESGYYKGMASLRSLGDVPADDWDRTLVAAVMRADVPVLSPRMKLRDAVALMREADVDRAAVLTDGRIVGTLQMSDILRLEELLDAVGDEERHGYET